jgi:hypothetical protein
VPELKLVDMSEGRFNEKMFEMGVLVPKKVEAVRN